MREPRAWTRLKSSYRMASVGSVCTCVNGSPAGLHRDICQCFTNTRNERKMQHSSAEFKTSLSYVLDHTLTWEAGQDMESLAPRVIDPIESVPIVTPLVLYHETHINVKVEIKQHKSKSNSLTFQRQSKKDPGIKIPGRAFSFNPLVSSSLLVRESERI